jgi:hypothetical protein
MSKAMMLRALATLAFAATVASAFSVSHKVGSTLLPIQTHIFEPAP